MKTEFSRRRQHLMSNYGRNALIQLIIACSVAFIMGYAMYVIFLVIAPDQKMMVDGVRQTVSYQHAISTYIGLKSFDEFLLKPWVVLTYAWAHQNFFQLLSNMLWLYCFGSVLQSLLGYKEIIPLFVLSYLLCGLLFLVAQSIFPQLTLSYYFVGALPSIMTFAIGAITLAPKFRFYLGERMSIPLWLVLAVFLLLNLATHSAGNYGILVLCLLGGLLGFVFVKLLQRGFRPGQGVYRFFRQLQFRMTPNHLKPVAGQQRRTQALNSKHPSDDHITADRVDMILDKINQKGYQALTSEEKEILMKASKE